MSQKDSAVRTIGVAVALCVFFSVIVSTTAVSLQPKQKLNKELDVKKNILVSAGMIEVGDDIEEAFRRITPVVVNLESGEIREDIDPESVNFENDIQNAEKTVVIPPKKDFAGIRRRMKNKKVYLVKNGDAVEKYILHVYGKGLWSTMYGFVVLKKDAKTVEGFSYYQHGETPGLGGEVDNPNWKQVWQGKEIYNDQGKVAIDVIKGNVTEGTANSEHKIDGLSGATITSNGVENTFQYWLGEHGYKKFLNRMASLRPTSKATPRVESKNTKKQGMSGADEDDAYRRELDEAGGVE